MSPFTSKEVFFYFIVTCFIVLIGLSNATNSSTPEYIRANVNNILKAFEQRPPPSDLCDLESHNISIFNHTESLTSDEKLQFIEQGIVNNATDVFSGIDEAVAAMFAFAPKIRYMLLMDTTFINSITYFAPITGRQFTVHAFYQEGWSPKQTFLDPKTGDLMYFNGCLPFPTWLNKNLRGSVPKPFRISLAQNNGTTTNFQNIAKGIAGRGTSNLSFGSNPWLDGKLQGHIQRRTIAFVEDSTTTTTNHQ